VPRMMRGSAPAAWNPTICHDDSALAPCSRSVAFHRERPMELNLDEVLLAGRCHVRTGLTGFATTATVFLLLAPAGLGGWPPPTECGGALFRRGGQKSGARRLSPAFFFRYQGSVRVSVDSERHEQAASPAVPVRCP